MTSSHIVLWQSAKRYMITHQYPDESTPPNRTEHKIYEKNAQKEERRAVFENLTKFQ